MKNDLGDLTYSRRHRWELFYQILYCILSAGLLIFIIIKDLPLPIAMSGITMSFVIGVLSVMYGLSRRHRRDHKQLHDMLAALLKQMQTDAEPSAGGNAAAPRASA